MPSAKLPAPPDTPCDLTAEQASFIRDAALRFFVDDAVVRNFGTDPHALRLHVETDRDTKSIADFLGVLLTRLDPIPTVSLTVRGSKVRGDAKIAYRQGRVL